MKQLILILALLALTACGQIKPQDKPIPQLKGDGAGPVLRTSETFCFDAGIQIQVTRKTLSNETVEDSCLSGNGVAKDLECNANEPTYGVIFRIEANQCPQSNYNALVEEVDETWFATDDRPGFKDCLIRFDPNDAQQCITSVQVNSNGPLPSEGSAL